MKFDLSFGHKSPGRGRITTNGAFSHFEDIKEALLIWLGRQKLCKGRKLQTLYSNTHVSKWRLLWPKSSDLCVEMMCGIDGYSWLYYGDRFVNFFLVSDVFVVSEVCFGLSFVSQSFIIELAFAHKKIFYCQVRTQNPRASFTFYFRTYFINVLKFEF